MTIVASDTGKGIRKTCYLYEGNVTRRRVNLNNGYNEDAYTYSSELQKNDTVQVWTGSQELNTIIVAAPDRSVPAIGTATVVRYSDAIGVIVTEPMSLPDYGIATGSTKTVSSHSYMRKATVEFPAFQAIREFTVNEATKAGALCGYSSGESQLTSQSGSSAHRRYVLLTSTSANGTGSAMF
jgi:hypothetical protein